MMKMILPFLLFLGVANATQPPIYYGPNNTTELSTPGLNFNGNVSIYSGTQNPSSVATTGVEGDLFIQYGSGGGKLYIKQDNGVTTSWTYLFAGTPGTGTGDVLHTGNTFGANLSLGANDNFNTSLISNGNAGLTVTPTQVKILNSALMTYGKALVFSDSGSNSVSIQSPATVASSFSMTLPTGLPTSGTDCLMISSTGAMSHAACYAGISSVGSGLSLVSGSFNVKSLIGTNNISIIDNGDGTVSLGETNTHLPGTGTVQSVNLYADDTADFYASGGPISSSGDFHFGTMIQAANSVWAAPDNRNGNPSFRKIVIGDLSSGSELANKVLETDGMGNFTYQTIPGALPHVVTTFNTRDGDVTLLAADVGAVSESDPVSHQWLNSFGADGAFTLLQPDFSDLSGQMTISQFSSATYAANLVPVTDGAGGVAFGPLPVQSVTTITGNYSPVAVGSVIIANCTADCAITLPDISTSDGVILRVKNINTTVVTMTAVNSETIDGNASYGLNAQYQEIDLVSKSGEWYVF